MNELLMMLDDKSRKNDSDISNSSTKNEDKGKVNSNLKMMYLRGN